MAWRFKASKYKNAAPIVPKPENYIRDICVGSYQTYGNNITASAQLLAFNWDYAGSSLAVFPLNDCGRKSKLIPLLNCHTDTVTDMNFSPFHDNLLATASQDSFVKIWILPENGLKESLSNPECQFSHKQRRVETVAFHPTCDFLIHSTSSTSLSLWDIINQKEIYSSNEHSDTIQSVSWKKDGKLLSTSCKDKNVRIIDPRTSNSCVSLASSHQNIKDSRIVWLSNQEKVLTTGFNAAHLRQVILRDTRNFVNPLKTLELDCSTGILMPLFDPDTNMLFLAGKGDATISYMEVADREPYLLEGLRHNGEQTKGACLVPKRALNVMNCEVNRILQLTGNAVIPVTYQVPRKSYREFHSDLYPETTGYKTELLPTVWHTGSNMQVAKINLDPNHKPQQGNNIASSESLLNLRETTKKITEELDGVNNAQNLTKKECYVYQGVKNMADKYINSNPNLNEHSTKKSTTKISKLSTKPTEEGDCKPKINQLKEEHLTKEEHNQKTTVVTGNGKLTTDLALYENGDSKTILPKPKPRTSRTNSTCEEVSPHKPVARPRTNSFTPSLNNNSSGPTYKPLLGPKPFTPFNLRETETFDKVFSVPLAPGRMHQNGSNHSEENINFIAHENYEETQLIEKSDGQEKESLKKIESMKIVENYKSTDNHQEKENPNKIESVTLSEKYKNTDNCGEEDFIEEITSIPNSQSMSAVHEDGFEEENNFERSSSERKSIAERRKMYEIRSQSVQDIPEKPKSPLHKQTSGCGNTTTLPKRISTVFGRVSKFRHLKGTPLHKSQHIENIRNLSRQIPGESDGFHANPIRVAVPLSGPGGKIAIFELKRTGRLTDGVIPALVHGQNIMDFVWDPFDFQRLVVACDDGTVKLWKIPENGLSESVNEAEIEFNAHNDKVYFVKFHPLAKDILATGSYDMTIKIWDLTTQNCKITLLGHSEQIFAFAWSPCGQFCSTFSKDGLIRVYEPRKNDQPIREGKGPVGTRGGRLTWTLNGRFLVVMGFDKVSERQVMVFKDDSLNSPLNIVGLDVSPSILIPFYDEDSSTLFLTGKGDSTIYAFEITEEPPYICPLTHHRCNNLHQGLSFLPKNCCDVVKVEFANALRLTNNTIEPLSFTVPRIKTDLFQDDLFPPTKVTWEPSLTSTEWFKGKNASPRYISLKPEGMKLLSETNFQESQDSKIVSKPSTTQVGYSNSLWNLDKSDVKNQQNKIKQAISDRLEINMKLEQDDMEGVDEKDWEEEQ